MGLEINNSSQSYTTETQLKQIQDYWAQNYYFPWVAGNKVINLRFVHPQQAGEGNCFHPVSRNPWEVIISGPVEDNNWLTKERTTTK